MTRPSSALDFKSATLYALRAVLHSSNTDEIIAALDERMREAGAFYENEAVVIDALNLEETPDWQALVTALRGYHLHPIGVQTSPALQVQATQAGLAPVDLSAGPATAKPPQKTAPKPAARRKAAPAEAIAEPAAATDSPTELPDTMVVHHPLRSGQRIYAKGCDLIVLGMVSQGAEVIADGNIHVYGPLRGKAMAGAHGRTDAMILTTQLDPELLAIAGVYRVVETRLPETLHNQAAQISLDGDTLRIRALNESGEHR
ncbi:MAG TPA: septum site-determining protein MinC [Castellaniella sp.]|uniref:septum site-determining protein MinC n=1 Tax=Castellaniella sp. TaxID=1955812 RepID=UPI002F229F8E